MNDLDRLLRKCGVTYFTGDEVVNDKRVYKGVANGSPPAEIWWHIIPTLKLLDRVRAEMGVPFIVTSGYRGWDYNRAVGGAENSQHCHFRAIDFWTRDFGAEEVAAKIREVLGEEFVAMFCGLGIYPDQNFVHFDTRGITANMRGATWRG